jgi:hypothetical protein
LAWIKIFLQLFNLFIDLGEAAELMLTALDFFAVGHFSAKCLPEISRNMVT